MFWLPTMTAHVTGIEAVRLTGKGYSASHPQMSFCTKPLELYGITSIILTTLSFSINCRIIYTAYTFGKQWDPALFVSY